MINLFMRCVFCVSVLLPMPAWSTSTGHEEANAHFTYQQRPIHPGLIRSFQNWLSDYRPPMTVTLDVGAAFESNQYGEIKETDDDGRFFIALDEGGTFA